VNGVLRPFQQFSVILKGVSACDIVNLAKKCEKEAKKSKGVKATRGKKLSTKKIYILFHMQEIDRKR